MRMISAQSITDTVARLCIKANTQLPQDVQAALEKAREEEPWPLAKTPPLSNPVIPSFPFILTF